MFIILTIIDLRSDTRVRRSSSSSSSPFYVYFVFVHTKAWVRRYQQLNYSIKTYPVHLPFFKSNSNHMSLPNVRFAVKTTSVTPSSITGRYQCTTQADRDVGYREWFKTVPAIYHEINMNERMN